MSSRALIELPGTHAPGVIHHRVLPKTDGPGSRDREYWVHVPRRPLHRRMLRRPALLMVLHGCQQDATEIMVASGFTDPAQGSDAVVVFPSVTSWSASPLRAENCWGFWIPSERRRDEGEIGDLRRILAAVEAEFATDPERRFVAGLSSGGAMSVAMAVVYGDAIRAAGSVAGLAFGETSAAVTACPVPGLCPPFLTEALFRRPPRLRTLEELVGEMAEAQELAGLAEPVPLMVLQSTRDRIVRIENARMLRDVWIARHGADPTAVEALRPDAGSVAHHRYRDRTGRTLVETVFYEGLDDEPTHYWPGDADRPPFAHSEGPSASATLMEFFRGQGL